MDNMEDKLTASEAVYEFCVWLTGRKEKTVMSSSDDLAVIADLVNQFCKENKLNEPRKDNLKYRKMPVVIDAIQWTGDNIDEVQSFMYPQEPAYMEPQFINADEMIGIETLEGLIVAKRNDYIIKGIKGEHFIHTNPIFLKKHMKKYE